MFNLLAGMNFEKLMIAFLSGMPQNKKEEWLAKMEQAQQQAAQTANDFAHIKESTDVLLERQNEILEKLALMQGLQIETATHIGEMVEETNTASTEAAIAADNTDTILAEIKDGE